MTTPLDGQTSILERQLGEHMSGITVDFPGGSATFPPGRTVRIGREAPCDVVIPDPRVSRLPHIELSHDGSAWVLRDHSRGGTYVDGVRIRQMVLRGAHVFRLGADADGPTIRVTSSGSGDGLDTEGRPSSADGLATISRDDDSLRLSLQGRTAVFAPGRTVLVGRSTGCDLRTDSLLVSRRHLLFSPTENSWLMEDLGSERGSFVDGRRLIGAHPVAGAFTVCLGGLAGGVAMDVVAAGRHHPPDKVATVTTVFTDLVGSTELLARLGDSAAHEFFREHASALSAIASEHAGETIKNTGDGLMVVFPSAVGALAGAAAMQRELDAGLRRKGVAMRIGLATGDAARELGDWFGVPVVQAARLCALAEGGQVLASEFVLTAAGRRAAHASRSLGSRNLKGLPEAVHVLEVQWAEQGDQPP